MSRTVSMSSESGREKSKRSTTTNCETSPMRVLLFVSTRMPKGKPRFWRFSNSPRRTMPRNKTMPGLAGEEGEEGEEGAGCKVGFMTATEQIVRDGLAPQQFLRRVSHKSCLLYTSDAA